MIEVIITTALAIAIAAVVVATVMESDTRYIDE